ncbi:hypothetical protein BHE74_00008835 [Ensete ventricosum]|nr:hypothetical protein BHE74_00008835 [Ensete ventricosum]
MKPALTNQSSVISRTAREEERIPFNLPTRIESSSDKYEGTLLIERAGQSTPEDVPEELALGFSGLFPVDLAEGMDLTLEQEFEEVIPTYLQRGPIEGARQSEDRSGEE